MFGDDVPQELPPSPRELDRGRHHRGDEEHPRRTGPRSSRRRPGRQGASLVGGSAGADADPVRPVLGVAAAIACRHGPSHQDHRNSGSGVVGRDGPRAHDRGRSRRLPDRSGARIARRRHRTLPAHSGASPPTPAVRWGSSWTSRARRFGSAPLPAGGVDLAGGSTIELVPGRGRSTPRSSRCDYGDLLSDLMVGRRVGRWETGPSISRWCRSIRRSVTVAVTHGGLIQGRPGAPHPLGSTQPRDSDGGGPVQARRVRRGGRRHGRTLVRAIGPRRSSCGNRTVSTRTTGRGEDRDPGRGGESARHHRGVRSHHDRPWRPRHRDGNRRPSPPPEADHP